MTLPSLDSLRNAVLSLYADLREKRLWPVAVLLLVAIVAVPLLLSSSPAHVAAPPATPPAGATPIGGTRPAVSVDTNPAQAKLRAAPRNPFTQLVHVSAPKTAGVATAVTTAAGATQPGSAAGKSAAGSVAATTHTSTPTTPAPTALAPEPATTPKPPSAPSSGLSATEAYHVAVALTTASGGLDARDLARLSVLPSDQQPLLVELGVLRGGNRVLFVVERGATVSGPGSCTPGPVDCEILALSPGQVETVSAKAGGVATQMAVTQVITAHHSSPAAAQTDRSSYAADGLKLLHQYWPSVLSLFPYNPSLGLIVDRRDLSAAGS
jgi:hypothetical protein